MKLLRSFFEAQEKHFRKGGPLEKAYPLFEGLETFVFTPSKVTKGAAHVRDALDLKRMMITVVVALIPCVFMAMYNTGYQAHLAISKGAAPLATWQSGAMQSLGYAFDPSDMLACVIHGALYYLPVLFVTFFVGGNCEVVFAIIRKHDRSPDPHLEHVRRHHPRVRTRLRHRAPCRRMSSATLAVH
jgi:Na+-transporting NADH:ubiquinone oxidoreductase subunit B